MCRFFVAAAVGCLVTACGKHADDREARELAALDVAVASTRVRAMVDGCDGFARALERLHLTTGDALAGLVDDVVTAAGEKCKNPLGAVRGDAAPQQLARARLLEEKPKAALAALDATAKEPAILVRRAELFDRLGDPDRALLALGRLAYDDAHRELVDLLLVSINVRALKYVHAANTIALAPLPERPALAFRAASDATGNSLDSLAAAALEPELATAVADRIEHEKGAAAAVAARRKGAELAPDRAEPEDALARALLDAGQIEDAVDAWDHAARIAPTQTAYRLAAVRALAGIALPKARDRVAGWAKYARDHEDIDEMLAASSAAVAVHDVPTALQLAGDAQRLRPGDGRLTFELAARFADVNHTAGAIETYAELLICGAHGHPWHRHEVAARLVALATDPPSAELVAHALDAKRPCETVDTADLASYTTGIREKLAALK